MDNRKIAGELLHMAKVLISTEFPNEEALKRYLKDHPGTDRTHHKVVDPKKKKETPDKVNGLSDAHRKQIGILHDEKKFKTYLDSMVKSRGVKGTKSYWERMLGVVESGKHKDVIKKALKYVGGKKESK